MKEAADGSEAVERLRSLLRIKTVSSEGVVQQTYIQAVSLLKKWMDEMGLETKVKEFVNGKPVLVASLQGTATKLPSVLLTGHYDVVPAESRMWSVEPFSGELHADGRIIGRGTQDMKSVIVQYIQALQSLLRSGWKPYRSIHISVLPDEEVGGLDGAAHFFTSELFENLNVGIALDEGLANPGNTFSLFHGERASCWVILRAKGPVGHGSRFVKNTAIEKMSRILHRIYSHRSELESHLNCNHDKSLGSILSMNVTAMKAGVPSSAFKGGFAVNVIPSEAEIAVDVRVPLDIGDIEGVIRSQWIRNETDIDIEFVEKTLHPRPDLITRPLQNDQWVKALCEGVKHVLPDVNLDLDIFPAGTDGRYIRKAGIPCIGFSPIRNTPILLHDKDEYISRSTFLEGIEVYASVINHLSSVK